MGGGSPSQKKNCAGVFFGGGGEAAVAQWLRCCATNRKVAGQWVDSASNRNEFQEYFLGIKAAGA